MSYPNPDHAELIRPKAAGIAPTLSQADANTLPKIKVVGESSQRGRSRSYLPRIIGYGVWFTLIFLGWQHRAKLTPYYKQAAVLYGSLWKAVMPEPAKLPDEITSKTGISELAAKVAEPLAPVVETIKVQAESYGALKLRSSGPAAEKVWPRGFSLTETPVIRVLKEDEAGEEFIYTSEPYEFHSDTRLGPDVLREFARIFKATYMLNCLLPLDLRPAPEQGRETFVAKIFQYESDFHAAGGMLGSAGTYRRDQGAILLPLKSLGVKIVNNRVQTDRSQDTDVLIHEVTHQMMNAWLPRLPVWFSEGSAEYVAMADYMHGRFYMTSMSTRLRSYIQRFAERGKPVPILSPGDLMKMEKENWNRTLALNAKHAGANYAAAAVLTYYFYHLDGQGDAAGIIAYLRDIEQSVEDQVAAERHLLRGRSVERLEDDFLAAYKKLGMEFVLTGTREQRLLKH
jgi:hypothetical protein